MKDALAVFLLCILSVLALLSLLGFVFSLLIPYSHSLAILFLAMAGLSCLGFCMTAKKIE